MKLLTLGVGAGVLAAAILSTSVAGQDHGAALDKLRGDLDQL